jgi:putative flippase GtrA
MRTPPEGVVRFVKFSIVGGLSALIFAVVYVVLRAMWPPAGANLVGLLTAVVFNTEANRLWTFDRARVPRIRMHLKGAALILVAYLFTTGAVLGLQAVHPHPDRLTEAAVVVVASGAMVILRFVGLDRWAIRPGGRAASGLARYDRAVRTGRPEP